MSNFKYNLQKVLDVKIKNEEEVSLKFQKKQSEKTQIENELNNMKELYSKYSKMNHVDTNNVIMQKITLNYLNTLDDTISNVNNKLNQTNQEINKIREDLIEKKVERQSFEKHKEKKLREYNKIEELKEQNTNDEFAIYGFIRNKDNIIFN